LRGAGRNLAADETTPASNLTAPHQAQHHRQRPAFILTDAIGDKAVFSGLVRLEPLAATIDAMLADTASYSAHKAHHGVPPQG
jgi:hypothetical protein